MNDIYLDELNCGLKLHLKSDWKNHKGSIMLLLKELARRLLLWKREIEKKGISIPNRILFDVSFVITGNRLDTLPVEKLIPMDEKLILSNYDHLMLRFYLNWLICKEEIENLGYRLPSPYEPFMEIIKRGGSCFKYERSRFEIYPYIGILIDPLEDYIKDVPFYKNLADLDLVDEMYK